jgi:hypothetical protein
MVPVKSVYNKWLITLSVILLSGLHCSKYYINFEANNLQSSESHMQYIKFDSACRIFSC